MALPVEINPLHLQTSGGYSVSKSLRFRSSASAYLSRTPSVTGNRQTWTWSGWIKRGLLTGTGAAGQIFGSNYSAGGFGAAFGNYSGAGVSPEVIGVTLYGVGTVTSTPVFRDPSAWYHVVLRFDSTQATQANRFILYVNGVQQTLSAALNVTQNANYNVNLSGAPHSMFGDTGGYDIDGYLAEVNFVDGQYLAPTSFGAYDTNGVWQPAKYSGTYGTNGFYLPFSNTTSTTTLVADSSGNGNNWTPNNISLTAGSTYDSMLDSPTVTSASVANYAVWNAITADKNASGSGGSITNANLYVTASGGSSDSLTATSTISCLNGKYYAEITCLAVGSAGSQATYICVNGIGYGAAVYFAYEKGGQHYDPTNGWVAGWSSWTTGDVIGVSIDQTTSTASIKFYKNNVLQGTLTYSTTASLTFATRAQYNASFALNCGQQPFTYTPPTGFNALNTYNLPTPAISNGAKYFAATTYTGNLTGQTITNGGNNTIGTTFQPDLVWVKSRSAATDHKLTDAVRGATKALISDTTGAETTDVTGLTAFASNGFTLGASTVYNNSGATYAAWQWLANGAGSSNTNGSITSTVSANTTAGFSVVTWTEPASGANTIGHGLGVAPSMIIVKARGTTTNWPTWHTSIGAANILRLNLTNASAADTGFNSTAPTSSVFSSNFGFNSTTVAYCWSAVAGFSAFGSYTGNGSADGPFVYTGFRPRWVMIKASSIIGNWTILDTSRSTYNSMPQILYADQSNAEASGASSEYINALSNGFKVTSSTAGFNGSGQTYIYAAFAENPFNSSRAR